MDLKVEELKKKFNWHKDNPEIIGEKMSSFEDVIPSETYDYFKNIDEHCSNKKKFSVCGLMNSGKSTFLNAIMKDTSNSVFQPGDYRLTAEEQREETDKFILIDAPGFDATTSDNDIAFNSFIKGNYHFFIHNITEGELTEPELSFLKKVDDYSQIDNHLKKTTFVLTHLDETDDADQVNNRIEEQLKVNFDHNYDIFCISSTDYIEGLVNEEDSLIESSNYNAIFAFLEKIYNKEDYNLDTFIKHRSSFLQNISIFKSEQDKYLLGLKEQHKHNYEKLENKVKQYSSAINKLFNSNKDENDVISEEILKLEKSIDSCYSNIQYAKDDIKEEKRYCDENCGLNIFENYRLCKDLEELTSDRKSDIRDNKRQISSYREKKLELHRSLLEVEQESCDKILKKINTQLIELVDFVSSNKLFPQKNWIDNGIKLNLDLILESLKGQHNTIYLTRDEDDFNNYFFQSCLKNAILSTYDTSEINYDILKIEQTLDSIFKKYRGFSYDQAEEILEDILLEFQEELQEEFFDDLEPMINNIMVINKSVGFTDDTIQVVLFFSNLEITITLKSCPIILNNGSLNFDGENLSVFAQNNSLNSNDFLEMVDSFDIQLQECPIEFYKDYTHVNRSIEIADKVIEVI